MDRDLFHLPAAHYLWSHSVGAQPKDGASVSASAFMTPWRDHGGGAWHEWLETLSAFQNGLAPLIGATAEDICPQVNVSSGITKIIAGLPERAKRTKIFLTEDDFPTVGFVLGQAQRLGYELCFLPGGERLADPDAWAPALHKDVQLVVATHVFSNTSVLAPVEEISRRAREAGVFCLLDIAQSVGSVPIRLNQWRPDFAVGTSVKYLCGGPGAAFLWSDPDSAGRTMPLDVGWFSHEDPYEFDIHHFEYAKGAARFTGGTPSIAPFAGALAGQSVLAKRGADAIYAHNQRLLARLTNAIGAQHFISTTKQGARGSGALIRVRDFDAAFAALKAAGVACDTRLGAVRVSLHLYNDERDVDVFAETIAPYL